MQGLKGDATYLVVTDQGEIEKYGINGAALHPNLTRNGHSKPMENIVHPHWTALQPALSSGSCCGSAVPEETSGCKDPAMATQVALLLPSLCGSRSAQALSCQADVPDSASDVLCLCSCLHALGMRRAME